jgi:hypothetical protein
MKSIYTLIILLAIATFVVTGCSKEGGTDNGATNAPAAPSTNK